MVNGSTVSFIINEDLVNSGFKYFNQNEINGLDKFVVFRYNENGNFMYPIEANYDYSNNEISFSTTEFGDYYVMDIDSWAFDIGLENNSSSNSHSSTPYSIAPFMSADFNTYDNIFNSFEDEIITFSVGEGDIIIGEGDFTLTEEILEIFNQDEQQIIQFTPSSAMPFNATSSENFEPVDVVFVIDCSDNLGNNFDNVKEQILETATLVSQNSEDARFAIIGFDFNNAYLVSNWTRSLSQLTSRLNNLEQTDETWSIMADPLRMVANDLTYRNGVSVFGVLIFDAYSQYIETDDDDYDFPEVINNMVSKGINFSILISDKTVALANITISMVTRTNGYIGTNMGNFHIELYNHISGGLNTSITVPSVTVGSTSGRRTNSNSSSTWRDIYSSIW